MTDTNKLKELAERNEGFDTQWKLDDAKAKAVEAMCMTWRHDFGLSKRHGPFGYSGMTPEEQDSLRSRMGQLFDHHIAHFVRDEEERSRSLVTLESGVLTLQDELIDQLKAKNEALRAAGQSLSNVAYNLAQMAGRSLTLRDCEVLDKARKAWDAAMEGGGR